MFGGAREIFARISPNLPKSCAFFAHNKFSPTKTMRSFFCVTSKKRVFVCLSVNVGRHILKSKQGWASFLPRFSGILHRISGIFPEFSTNLNFWWCACIPPSYTTVPLHAYVQLPAEVTQLSVFASEEREGVYVVTKGGLHVFVVLVAAVEEVRGARAQVPDPQ